MTSRAFRDRLARRTKAAGVSARPEEAEQLEAYFRLLTRWNEKVNLTALPLEDPTDETFDRLFIEALGAARLVQDSADLWFDVGSGGGSPAIPLKIVRPHLDLVMVESKARKAAFLREVVRGLKLSGATVETARFEDVAAKPDSPRAAGLVTLRAVRPDPKLVDAIAQTLRTAGTLLLFRPSPQPDRLTGFELQGSTILVSTPSRPAYALSYQRG